MTVRSPESKAPEKKSAGKPKLTPEERKKAKEAAAEKARKALEEELQSDQAWLDAQLSGTSEDEKYELFLHASKKCKNTTYKDGKITLACPIAKNLIYCVDADSFTCDNGKVGGGGCKLSEDVSKALKDTSTCIDGNFVSEAEGGSYLSPYVPWGPINGKAKGGKPKPTTGNSSGVTIGTGVDLGALSDAEKYLKELKEIGVSAETREQLRPFISKKREVACKALREAKSKGPIVLPSKDVELIDLHAFKIRVPILKKNFNDAKATRVAALKKAITKEKAAKKPDEEKIKQLEDHLSKVRDFDSLSCAEQTILFSTLYHEGSIGKAHSKPFVNALIDNDSVAAEDALTKKTKSGNKVISDRGKRELKYLKNKQSKAAAPTA